MNEAMRKKMIYVLLGAAIIYGAANLPGGSDNKKEKAVVEQPKPANKRLTAPPTQTIDVEYFSSLSWGSDPFYRESHDNATITRSDTPGKTSRWILNGVVINDKATVAVVNKKIVHIGDKIGDARVVAITKDKVVLEQDGSEFSIHITKDES